MKNPEIAISAKKQNKTKQNKNKQTNKQIHERQGNF